MSISQDSAKEADGYYQPIDDDLSTTQVAITIIVLNAPTGKLIGATDYLTGLL